MTINIHPTARISVLADIEDSTRGTLIDIAEGVVVDSFVKVKPAGGVGNMYVGENSVINSGCVIYTSNGVKIGASVLIAANCTLAPVNHSFADKNRTIRSQGFTPSKGGIVIEDDVWIGSNCVILDGALIRQGCVIAAGSIVRGELAEFGVYAGNPATLLRPR